MKTFSVIEYASFFAVRHNATGQEAHMGDGVDALFTAATNKPMSPGAKGFVKAWEKSLNESESDTLEAYFPELYAAENKETK